MSDSIKQIKAMGATNIALDISDSGIVKIYFDLNDVRIEAQADIDNSGFYAIQVPGLQGLAKLIAAETEAIK